MTDYSASRSGAEPDNHVNSWIGDPSFAPAPFVPQPEAYTGPPSYGQPVYGQYGQPGYGQSYDPGSGYGQVYSPTYQPYPPEEPRWVGGPPTPGRLRPRRRTMWLAVVVVVLAAFGAYDVFGNAIRGGSNTSGRTVVLPTAFGTFVQVNTANTQKGADAVRSALTSFAPQYGDSSAYAVVGFYTSSTLADSSLTVLAFNASSSTDIRDQLGSPTDEHVDQVMLGAKVADAANFDPGTLGGTMQCGTAVMSQTNLVLCVWADRSTLGVVIRPAVTPVAEVAADTVALRNAAEH
jgi:hypothetical protein